MRSTVNQTLLASALLALASTAQATTTQPEKKPAPTVTVKTTAAHSTAKANTRKETAKKPAVAHKAAASKPAKVVAAPTPAPKPTVPPEVLRRIAALEDSNKALDARVGELSQSLAALGQRHADLKQQVDNPPPPPPLPKPEVPSGPLVLTGLLGALLGFLGSLAGGLTKSRRKDKTVQNEEAASPAVPAEPALVRQEPSVS